MSEDVKYKIRESEYDALIQELETLRAQLAKMKYENTALWDANKILGNIVRDRDTQLHKLFEVLETLKGSLTQ